MLLGQQTADRETDRKPGKQGQVKVEYKWPLPRQELGRVQDQRLGSLPSLPSLSHRSPSPSNAWLLSFTHRFLNYSPQGHRGTLGQHTERHSLKCHLP